MRIARTHHPMVQVASLLVILMAGCAHTRPKKTVVNEPPLLSQSEAAIPPVAIETPTARPASVADRHPLLRRPREMYDETGGSKLVKSAAATVIGVPSGIGAEIRQLVSGQPAPK